MEETVPSNTVDKTRSSIVNHLSQTLPMDISETIVHVSELSARCDRFVRIMHHVHSNCRLMVDLLFFTLLEEVSCCLSSVFLASTVSEFREKLEYLVGDFFWSEYQPPSLDTKEDQEAYVRSMKTYQRRCQHFLQQECIPLFMGWIDEVEEHIMEETNLVQIDLRLWSEILKGFQFAFLDCTKTLYRLIDEDDPNADDVPARSGPLRNLCYDLRVFIPYYVLFDLRPYIGMDALFIVQHTIQVLFDSLFDDQPVLDVRPGHVIPEWTCEDLTVEESLHSFFTYRLMRAIVDIKDDIEEDADQREDPDFEYHPLEDGYIDALKHLHQKLLLQYRVYKKNTTSNA